MNEKEQKKKEKDWKNDPRLAMMDEKKISFLYEFSEKMKKTPREKMMSFLLALRGEAAKRHIEFSDSETLLIASVLSTDMTPEQKRRMELLRSMTKKTFH